MGTYEEREESLLDAIARMVASDQDPVVLEQQLWQRYGETVATLILDTSGFTRVSESHGIVHCLIRLVELRALCEPLLRAQACNRLHFEADNVFATFAELDDALRAAEDIHRAVHDAGLMLTESERFTVCIGIGYGRMLYSGPREGYFAREMNLACKLGEDVADGDETLLTRSAWEQLPANDRRAWEARETLISGVQLPFYRRAFAPG